MKASKLKIFKTANLYFAFVTLGMAVAITGPTLLDLERAVNTDTEHISYIIVGRGIGYLIGSIVGGILFDRFNRQVLFLVNILILAISMTAAPWCRDLSPLIATMTVGGLTLGAIDTGGNCWCLHLWGKESGPYFQALHFTFGVGTLIAPILAEPFLIPANTTDGTSEAINVTDPSLSWKLQTNLTEKNNRELEQHNGTVFEIHDRFQIFGIEYAFAIIGVFTFVVFILFFIAFIIKKSDITDQTENEEGSQTVGLRFTLMVLAVSVVFMICYAGLEVTYGQMIATFAVVGPLKLSKSKGSFITSVYWGSYTFARGMAVFISLKLSSLVMLVIDIFIVLGATLLLVIFSASSEEVLWLGSGLLGIGLASMYPSMVSWVERYIVMTNKVTSTFIVTTSLGEMIVPLVVGHYIERKPMFLMHIMLAGIICAFLACLIIWQFMNRQKSKYDTVKRNIENGESSCLEDLPTGVDEVTTPGGADKSEEDKPVEDNKNHLFV
ncbi:sodium-dependent glucose transporter 1A-like [Limulus polyphemus]|uniref:Sodium-dependent glucose transporter 1A-like n=1 Tax=Limulus polyphemus TaxID=6850 RepID=A0ABM1BTH7_LIMPO|nr:sodium-dependent glucose transporter 1A-like [Limulus polyphemus]